MRSLTRHLLLALLNGVLAAGLLTLALVYAAQLPPLQALALAIHDHAERLERRPLLWRIARWAERRLDDDARYGYAAPLAWPERRRQPVASLASPVGHLVSVYDVTSLRAALSAARPGDTILLEPGDYLLTQALSLRRPGLAAAPIGLRPLTAGTARFLVNGPEGLRLSAAYWIVEGIVFRGVCRDDDLCDHAIHAAGNAEGAVIRGNSFEDFNAPLKLNGERGRNDSGSARIEDNIFAATRPRNTKNKVAFIDISGGSRMTVRGNVIRDFAQLGRWSGHWSFGIDIRKSGKGTAIERNLILCAASGGYGHRAGIRIGGGESFAGVVRDNIVANCSESGIIVEKAREVRIERNLLYRTKGIDLVHEPTFARITGNVFDGRILASKGAVWRAEGNVWSPFRAAFLAGAVKTLLPGIASGRLDPAPSAKSPLRRDLLPEVS